MKSITFNQIPLKCFRIVRLDQHCPMLRPTINGTPRPTSAQSYTIRRSNRCATKPPTQASSWAPPALAPRSSKWSRTTSSRPNTPWPHRCWQSIASMWHDSSIAPVHKRLWMISASRYAAPVDRSPPVDHVANKTKCNQNTHYKEGA